MPPIAQPEIEEEIRRFLFESFPLGDDPAGLADGDSLVEAGLIDSTGVLELVGHLESTYGIAVADDELIPENLDTIGHIVGFVHRKLTGAAAGNGSAL